MKLFLIAFSLACCASTTYAIVGGEPASKGEFPFQVSVRGEVFGHICGGAIISPNLVITAAACTDPRGPPLTEIVAGSLKRNETLPWEQVRTVNRIVNHPGYNGTTMDNDLALLFLNEPYVFNENVSAIRLPPALVETAPNPVLHTGWGNVQYNTPLHDDLQKVTLDSYTDAKCSEMLDGRYVRTEILCTGADEGGRGGCQGDAGSPLFVTTNTTYLVAVGSHFPCLGDCCGIPGPNNQNTELAFYMDWILEQSRLYGGGL